MGVIEEARQAELARRAASSAEGKRRAVEQAEKQCAALAQEFGVRAEIVSFPIDVVIERTKSGDRVPGLVRFARHFVLAGEVILLVEYASALGLHGVSASPERWLLLPCPRCQRFRPDFSAFYISVPRNATTDQRAEKFIEQLGRRVLEPKLCAFCQATEDGLRCPACHREYAP